MTTNPSEHIRTDRCINAHLELMKVCARDKANWDLFVFAVKLKVCSGNSAIEFKLRTVMNFLKCGYRKASRLMEAIKEGHPLFRYEPGYKDGTGMIIAKRFIYGLEKSVFKGRKADYEAEHARCVKVSIPETMELSHREMSCYLRDILISYPMVERQRAGGFRFVQAGDVNRRSTRNDRKSQLTQKRIARIAGVCRSTVSRHVWKMKDKGILDITTTPFLFIRRLGQEEYLTDEESLLCRKPFLHQGYEVVRDAYEYNVLNNTISRAFVHVIFNHRKRIKSYSSIGNGDLILGHLNN